MSGSDRRDGADRAAESAPVVAVSDLRFRWREDLPDLLAVDDLRIAAGEKLFLRGASGSGKTTLLNLLAGVLTPRSGRVELLGRPLSALSGSRRDRRRADHVGFIFQMFNLLPWLSVVENVLLPCRFSARRARMAGDPPRAEAQRLLDALGLSRSVRQARDLSELSVGQQQRVALAGGLIGRPELVIADEPTLALDTDARDDFLALLEAETAAAGSALLFVSHDASLADRFDRQLDMDDPGRPRAAAVGTGRADRVRGLVHLALASLWSRRFTAGLTLVSITLSVVLLLGVEKIRTEARDGFRATVSGTDLIVGARTGPVQLQQLFSLVGVAKQALLLVSALVVVAGLAGMMTMVLASLAERRREMAILRSVGARPLQILMLLLMETFSLTLIGALTGFLLVQLLTLLAGPALGSVVGILPTGGWPSAREWLLLAAVTAGGTLAGSAGLSPLAGGRTRHPALSPLERRLCERLQPRTGHATHCFCSSRSRPHADR